MSVQDLLPSEETPLLSPPPQRSIFSSFSRPFQSIFSQARSPSSITAIVLATLLWFEFGGYLMAVPVLRVYEDIICHHYYDRLQGEGHIILGGDIDESMCKKDDIQNELSIIVAGTYFLGAIPGLFLTIPYGMLMDRIGRKPIFILAITGTILSYLWNIVVMWLWHTLPLRLTWLGPIFTVIGGGPSVGSMAFFAIVSDITSEAKRTNIFFLAAATDLVAQLIAPSLAALLMAKSPWIPILLGISFLTLGSLLILFIPETLHMQDRRTSTSHVALATSTNDFTHNCKPQNSLFAAVGYNFSHTLRTFRLSLSILNSAPLVLLLITFIIKPLSSQSEDISLRYISNRFHFPLRLSSFLWSLRAAVQIILFLLILPFLSKLMITYFKIPSSKKDLHLARASILILTLGSLLIALAPTLPLAILGMAVFTLGAGFISMMRSLITTLVDRQHKGQLYAAVAVVETTGRLIAGPGFAQLYIEGLRLKGIWVGLPFFGMSFICGLAVVAVWSAGWIMSRRNWEWENGGGEVVRESDDTEDDGIAGTGEGRSEERR
ncbi:uncharacterized protein EAE98_003412 [Botrytis deweyae]|uniref:Major facilitator superfamily (MFS) profile domain-containing protein n=1 Tax=Botrytis deweyae TaxID=2478750 RepID=A0ABQ7ITM3_9HELO|nr:uncharacterized protein EAE98_003412 [Botrytis deweyae]KAF7933703.1 hypothetical protein EAE98_003412 [Botrytis deweyae]